MALTRPYLVLATPGMGNMVDYRFMQSLFRLMFYCNSHRIPVALEMITHDPILARARNTLAAKFLDRTQASHILFLSPQTRFSVPQILAMLALDQDIVAAQAQPEPRPAPQATPLDSHTAAPEAITLSGGDPGVQTPTPAQPPLQTARETEYASPDFMLIRRSVFPRLFAAYAELRCAGALDDSSGYKSPNLYTLFEPGIDSASREYLSGGEAFCRRWRAIGGKIFIAGAPAAPHARPGSGHK